MTKKQLIVTCLMVILFCIIYFLGDTKSKDQKLVEKSRSENIESTGIQNLLTEARSALDDNQIGILNALTSDVDNEVDSLKIVALEKLSGTWYGYGFPSIAGHYAEEIANISNTEKAWSITGTTYGMCLKSAKNQKTKDFCWKRSIRAYENAISINPENVDHKVNLALSYVESPPQDNPMKGILMLRELSEKHPTNAGVLKQLGRLAIMTGQYEKAEERLLQALEIDPRNKDINCLLVETYIALNRANDADKHKIYCK